MNKIMKTQSALYPIREVSRLTGINSITLRAWERRYDLFEPIRTESGHRLFTQAHIDRINAAVKLTEQGIPISQVKRFLDAQNEAVATVASGDDYDYGQALKQAIKSFELERLHRELDTLFSELDEASSYLLLRKLTLKVNALSQSESVFWESVLLPRLYVRLHNMMRKVPFSSSQRVLVQSSEQNSSELLLLLAGLHLASQGWYPLLQTRSESDVKSLFSLIQALKCQALALVDDSGAMDEGVWSEWVTRYPALDFFYFVNQASVDSLNKQLSVHYHALNNPF